MSEENDDLTRWQFATTAVHAALHPDPTTGAVITPIYQTSTFAQTGVAEHKGFEYSRTDNPTRSALQEALAALEGGRFALSFASGMAAIDTLLRLLRPGDHVVAGDDLYGGTYRLFEQVLLRTACIQLRRHGRRSCDAAAVQPHTRLVWVETPTNPLLKLADIAAAAAIAHEAQAWLAVDNTFASPALQRPLALGADFVIHSTTKYLGGHSDAVGGAVVLNDEAAFARLKFLQNAAGAVPGPMDCFLTLRGIRTLALRMAAHCQNAQQVAEFLDGHRPWPRSSTRPPVPLAGRLGRKADGCAGRHGFVYLRRR